MAKVTLSDILGQYASVTELNNNFALIEAALENTVSRDGTTPNTMSADLDMNSNQITNVPNPTSNSDAVNKLYVDTNYPLAGLVSDAVYSSVANMKLESIDVGSFVQTKGYYTSGDSGNATYLIVAPQSFDSYGDHELANSNIAVLQFSGLASIRKFGAKGSGDDTLAIQACIDRGNSVYVPEGTYQFTSLIINEQSGYNQPRFIFEGDGAQRSVLECTSTTANALTITDTHVEVRNISVNATAARTAGSGKGIYIDSLEVATTTRVSLKDIQINGQPGIGIHAKEPELHHYENVFINEPGGHGVHLDGDTGEKGINNTLINVRVFDGGARGIFADRVINTTIINPTVLNCVGPEMIFCNRRSATIINGDVEAISITTGATSTIGLKLSDDSHNVLGGTYNALNEGIVLSSADNCFISNPHFTNADIATPMTTGVQMAGSTNNTVIVKDSYTNVTESVSPSSGTSGNFVKRGPFTNLSSYGSKVVSASVSGTYAPDLSTGTIFVLTLTGNTTIATPTNGRDGQKIEFVIYQDGTGGYTLTFSAQWRSSWSDTGNIASARSSVNFSNITSGVYQQIGAQQVYY